VPQTCYVSTRCDRNATTEMSRSVSLLRGAVACLLIAGASGSACSKPLAIDRRITHPDGVWLHLQTIDFQDASIVVAATIANPGDREIALNRGHSFVLNDGARGVYHLSPPADNPELRIGPREEVTGNLIFIGPLASAARRLMLWTNRGTGTRDNPYDDAPVLEAPLPLDRHDAATGAAVSHPDGAALRAQQIAAGPNSCLVRLLATNGSDRTVVLNHDQSLVLTDDRGAAAPLRAPLENGELVVPAGDRLDAELVFDCRAIDIAGQLSLVTNRGTAGTADNPYETLPVLTLKLPVERHDAAMPTASKAVAAPIERSHLSEAVATDAAAPAAAPVTSQLAAPAPSATPARAAAPAASGSPAPTPPGPAAAKPKPPPTAGGPRSLSQLEAELHAEKTDRGVRLVMPADSLFAEKQAALNDPAAPPLTALAQLAAAIQPREIVIIGHTDSTGDDEANLTLSKEQVHAVAAWLAAHAAKRPPHFIEQGYGRTRPVAPNHNADGSDNPGGRAANRRLEILLRR